ncbi:MmgE/PrpD family protein [Bordetella sp. BOR01]|uniref:MmgE/PrpD family protein n=1 Tax=Bordetella sp. BOR01 TaxID=2854779 RepID=UPI001C481A97|nr:MmgE/PrpD family protein [Bordetella sp. BOR01]MBV7482199.1 MmgE/PrpD family protein [Bordetella sp. BOR01]
MSRSAIGQLTALTQNLRLPDLSHDTITAAKRAILDALGCAIAAIGCEPARIAGPLVGGSGNTTVIGEAGTSSLERAVLLNGIMVRYLDMMDVYWAQDVCHPAENVPLALACVEEADGSGARLIEAVTAGYEGQMRLTHLASLQGMGMHHVTAAGIVAPLVVGKAWNLPENVVEQAVALSGCRQFTVHAMSKGGISMAKAIGYAWSAMDSILAVRLAQGGFTGPTHFLDWLAQDGPMKSSYAPEALQPGGAPLIAATSFKQFPVQFELQTPNEVALRLHAQLGGQPIERVEITVPPITAKRTADPSKFKPANRETADHSLPVTVAMSLLDGKLTAAQFERDRWAAADVLELVQRTTVHADGSLAERYPQGRPACVTVHTADGRQWSEFQDVPYGDAARPLEDAALTAKFLANARDALGTERAQAVADCVWRLERVEHIAELTALLRAA